LPGVSIHTSFVSPFLTVFPGASGSLAANRSSPRPQLSQNVMSQLRKPQYISWAQRYDRPASGLAPPPRRSHARAKQQGRWCPLEFSQQFLDNEVARVLIAGLTVRRRKQLVIFIANESCRRLDWRDISACLQINVMKGLGCQRFRRQASRLTHGDSVASCE